MVRQIRLDQIDDVMAEAVQELVQKTTLRWTELSKKATPVVSGNLRNGWKTDIRKFKGTIINNVEYAEPVTFGTNLPPTWKNGYQLTTAEGKEIPKDWATRLIEQTERNMMKELRSL